MMEFTVLTDLMWWTQLTDFNMVDRVYTVDSIDRVGSLQCCQLTVIELTSWRVDRVNRVDRVHWVGMVATVD